MTIATLGRPLPRAKRKPATIGPSAAPPRPTPMMKPVPPARTAVGIRLRDDRIEPDDGGVGAHPRHAGDERQAREIGLALAEHRHHHRGEEHRHDHERTDADALRERAERERADQSSHVGPHQHPTGRRRREAHVDDDLRDPLQDEVEGHEVREVREGEQHGRARERRREELRHPRARRVGARRGERAHGRVAESTEHGVDALERRSPDDDARDRRWSRA